MRCIFDGLGIPWPTPEMWSKIKRFKTAMLVTEARDVMTMIHPDWKYCEANGFKPLQLRIHPWEPAMTKAAFLNAYREYRE